MTFDDRLVTISQPAIRSLPSLYGGESVGAKRGGADKGWRSRQGGSGDKDKRDEGGQARRMRKALERLPR